MFVGKVIDEDGEICNGFLSYIFLFLITLFKDLPLLLGIRNRSSVLNLDVTDAMGGNNCYD